MEQKIKEWIDSVTSAGCVVNSFSTLKEIRKRDGSLLFALLDANVTAPDGTQLPNIIFIRGHACVIVPLVIDCQTSEQKFLMVRQRRIGSGQLSLEFPAGMLDEQTADPVGVAVRELEEETGIKIESPDIFLLHKNLLYSSVGGSDEGIYFFGCILKFDHTTFTTFGIKKGGNIEEGECIHVELISKQEAENEATSMQVPLGFCLLQKYLSKNEQLLT